MSKQIIRLKEALELMENATVPFSIRYVACNKKKGTSGYWLSIVLYFVTGDQPKKAKATQVKASTSPAPTTSKNPHYYENFPHNPY